MRKGNSSTKAPLTRTKTNLLKEILTASSSSPKCSDYLRLLDDNNTLAGAAHSNIA